MAEQIDVSFLQRQYQALKEDHDKLRKSGDGPPPGGGDLEKRVEKLEATVTDVQVRLVRIETRLEQNATKADLNDLAVSFHKSMNEQTWKFLGGASALAALFSAIAVAATKLLGS